MGSADTDADVIASSRGKGSVGAALGPSGGVSEDLKRSLPLAQSRSGSSANSASVLSKAFRWRPVTSRWIACVRSRNAGEEESARQLGVLLQLAASDEDLGC